MFRLAGARPWWLPAPARREAPAAPAHAGQINPALAKAAHWLDEAFRVPGTNFRVGLDGLLGLIPGVGDAATALYGLLILNEAKRLGVPGWTRFRMGMNTLVDMAFGAIPIVGDLFDFGFKANRKNYRLLQEHVARRNPPAPAPAAPTR